MKFEEALTTKVNLRLVWLSGFSLQIQSVLWIRIRIGSGFNGVAGSGSGFAIWIRIQEGKNDAQT
jgi:hypothetical protein